MVSDVTQAKYVVLKAVVALLEGEGIPVMVFGGWAEELLGRIEPWPHSDIDLLYVGSGPEPIDAFLARRPGCEIEGKRFSHKRAFKYEGVLIEIFVATTRDSLPVSVFFDREEFIWPDPLVGCQHEGLTVASATVLDAYREAHERLTTPRGDPHFALPLAEQRDLRPLFGMVEDRVWPPPVEMPGPPQPR